MFRRTRTRSSDRELQQIRRQSARLLDAASPFETPLSNTATPAPAQQQQQQQQPQEELFLPAMLRVPPAGELAGSMMRYWAPLTVGGEVLACGECGAYRDWLVLHSAGRVWVRCRSGHETSAPGLDSAWYEQHTAPIDGLYSTREEALRALGFDGTFGGTVL